MTADSDVPAAEGMRQLAVLHQLTLEAGLAENRRELIFRILNHSIRLGHYDRAVLLDPTRARVKLLGVSGQSEAATASPRVEAWTRLASVLDKRDDKRILTDSDFGDRADVWRTLAEQTGGLSVLWLPIRSRGKTVAALWLERYGQNLWTDAECKIFSTLTLGYGIAWRGVPGRKALLSGRGRLLIAALVLLCAVLAFCPMRMRVVAPCEVVTRHPYVAAAPVDGVIDEVRVRPGQPVKAGDLLYVYDRRQVEEEVNVAVRDVNMAKSELEAARMKAFDDSVERARVALLEQALERGKVRLEYARRKAEKLEVRAGQAGVVVIDDPESWRGRPVQVGQRVVLIADPEATRVRIHLGEADHLGFPIGTQVAVVLHAMPEREYAARLTYVAAHMQMSPEGRASFLAEAEWGEGQEPPRLGQTGSAVLKGESTTVGYYLLRRPLMAVRNALGF